MTDTPPPILPEQDPLRERRSQAAQEQIGTVTFARKGLPEEKLESLRKFLKGATSDEIAAVRKMYSDIPVVMEMIGFEVMPQQKQVVTHEDSDT